MNKRGFTLIELLVAISIIGILATLVSANLNSIRSRARDTARKSDLKQYSTSLETFGNASSGFYPPFSTAANASSDLCTVLSMTSCPDDPLLSPDPSQEPYKYISDVDGIEYLLWAKLESGANDWWIVCSTGQSGIGSAEPISSSCPL